MMKVIQRNLCSKQECKCQSVCLAMENRITYLKKKSKKLFFYFSELCTYLSSCFHLRVDDCEIIGIFVRTHAKENSFKTIRKQRNHDSRSKNICRKVSFHSRQNDPNTKLYGQAYIAQDSRVRNISSRQLIVLMYSVVVQNG